MDSAIDRGATGRSRVGIPEALGAMIGIGIVGPLFGQIAGLPSRYVADLAVVLAICVFWLRPELRGAPARFIWLLGPLAVYFVLVVASARGPQWAFLLHPGMWRGHADDYVDAKLLLFLVSFLGPVVSALLLAHSRARDRVANAVLWTVLVIGLIALARLATFSNVLIETTETVSRTFFLDGSRGFSPVSYGLLFLMAGISSLFLPRAGLLSALFLAACFILHRRMETITLFLAVLAYYANSGLLHHRRGVLLIGAATIILAAILIIVLHNGGSLDSWTTIESSVQTRVGIASGAVTVEPAGSIWTTLFGHGLGSAVTASAQWPHNLLLETYIESGAITLAALIVTLFAAAIISRPAVILANSGLALCTAALAVAVFLFSLKSTDVTSTGTLMSWVVIATALARRQIEEVSP